MGTFRVHKDDHYTIIHNHIFLDNSLSWKAKGLLTQILSLPPTWDYTEAGLTKLAKDGLTSTRGAIRELEEAGYLIRTYVRNEKGQVSDINYDVFETPQDAAGASAGTHVFEAETKTAANAQTANPAHREEQTEQVTASKSMTPKLGEPIMDNPISGNPTLENPISGEPILGFPISGFPILENHTQLNTNKINNPNELNPHHQASENPNMGKPEPGHTDDDELHSLKPILDDIRQSDDTGHSKIVLNEICDAVEDVMRQKTQVRLNGTYVDAESAHAAFSKLTKTHILRVADLVQNTGGIVNRKSYIKTALWNELNKTRIAHGKSAVQGQTYAPFEQREYDYDALERALLAR